MEALFDDPTRAEMVDLAEPWRPYRSYASLYLWRAVD
jgi:DNA-3-methyladenine glycosylase II